MARYYGLGQTAGFADGLAQGFGLVNEVYNDKEINRLKQEELDATSAYRMAETEATSKYRDQQFGLETRGADLADKEFDLTEAESIATRANQKSQSETNLLNANTARTNAETANARSATQGRTADEAIAQGEFDRKEEERKRRNTVGAESLSLISDMLKSDNFDPDEYDRLIQLTEGTSFDVSRLSGDSYATLQSVAEQRLSAMLQSENPDLNDPELLASAGSVINAGVRKGEIVDDSFVNAPEGLRNGEFIMHSKDVLSLKVDLNDGNPFVAGTVRVHLQHKDNPNNFVHYDAPMTGGGRLSSTSNPAQIPVQDLLNGMKGMSALTSQIQQDIAPSLKAARIEQMGGRAAYRQAVQSDILALNTFIEKSPEAGSLISGVKNIDLTQKDIAGLASDRMLGLGHNTEPDLRETAKSTIIKVRDQIENSSVFNADLNKFFKQDTTDPQNTKKIRMTPADLSDSQILLLASQMDQDATTQKYSRRPEYSSVLESMLTTNGYEMDTRSNMSGFFDTKRAQLKGDKP